MGICNYNWNPGSICKIIVLSGLLCINSETDWLILAAKVSYEVANATVSPLILKWHSY